MKRKCTSKRQFKKIIKQMIPHILMNRNMVEIYASDIYNCGLKKYQGMEITYIHKVWFHDNPHQIYIAPIGMWGYKKHNK
jgi:hypothetical protein